MTEPLSPEQEEETGSKQAPKPGLGQRIFRWLVGLLILSLVLGSILLYLGWRDYRAFVETPLAIPEQGLVFEILPGSSIRAISREMVKAGWLASAERMEVLARSEHYASRIQAGRFRLESGMTPRDVLKRFASGKVLQYQLTLLEGWNFRQIMQAVTASDDLSRTLPNSHPDTVMQALGFPDQHPEGRFFPDTYHFPADTTDVRFLARAYRTMQERLRTVWETRDEDLPLASAYEALILASIIEKETGMAAERPQIAGVFVRRLRKGMRLQTDPTVIYGMGEAYQGNIRRRDLRADTPYNTYTRKGLPPTPIAMPGAGALSAAVHPAAGDSLYFVAKGDGSHHFSATLKEHNKAVRTYQLKRQ